jgi:hypothetical protein
MDSHRDAFLSLSAYLTGFERIELQGTGMLDEYYTRVSTAIDEVHLERLWSITRDLDAMAGNPGELTNLSAEIKRLIMDNEELGSIGKNIIKLWYRGDWPDSGAKFGVSYTSARAYQEGLIWKAMRAHPPGAKQPGFGSWSTRPPK